MRHGVLWVVQWREADEKPVRWRVYEPQVVSLTKAEAVDEKIRAACADGSWSKKFRVVKYVQAG